jgi:hypothetical protein
MVADVQPLEKLSTQHAGTSQFFEDVPRVADPEQYGVCDEARLLGSQ